jgi:hypothetical protein
MKSLSQSNFRADRKSRNIQLRSAMAGLRDHAIIVRFLSKTMLDKVEELL